MKSPRKSTGFALISTLAVLVAVAILITAFVSTMRTERIASHNYSEQRQAQALAQGMLNRILAEHAGMASPYEVDSETKQPTAPTKSIYLANQPAEGIFRMEPQDDVDTGNHLVRLSGGGAGEAAYQPEDWAYLRLKDSAYGNTFLPKDSSGNPAAPEWIDYTLPGPSGGVVGQVAFAIWEESGKFDVNILGKDEAINGVAPHDLQIEQELDVGGATTWLNGDTDPARQRNNFSLRKISIESNDNTDNTGDDRRFFSIEELLQKGWVTPDNALNLTTFSRDFDVRPEWDGKREAGTAKDFLRSYVNNPDLYKLMWGSGEAGPQLVQATMNEQTLRNALPGGSSGNEDSWMQIMRLLAALRLSLPPFGLLSASNDVAVAVNMNQWTNEDIWGIALNIVQASDAKSDQNLIAKKQNETPGTGPNHRYGIRLSPYITEIAFKVENAGSGNLKVSEYMEIWNPYPVDLSGEKYRIGDTTGGNWPASGNALYSQHNQAAYTETEGPGPGEFKTVLVTSRTVNPTQDSGAKGGFRVRTSPYMTDVKYFTTTAPANNPPFRYPCSRGPAYSGGGAGVPTHLTMYIPASEMPGPDKTVWYSYQIDDPRMGPFTRYSPTNRPLSTPQTTDGWTADDIMGDSWKYTWQGYFNRHSLAGSEYNDDAKYDSPHGDGYNINFGENWPDSWSGTSGLNRALATFALPGRPFRNVGELGTVYAFRPWRTLSFAKTIAPEDNTLASGTVPENWPATLLDYLTTVGTTSEDENLNYKPPHSNPAVEDFVSANIEKREQDKRWLFEKVEGDEPTGNLRPIRGRINLNTSDEATLTTLLKAPYRMVNSFGLKNWSGINATPVGSGEMRDLEVTINSEDANKIANAIDDIRPLRSLADFAKLSDHPDVKAFYGTYPESVMDAIMGRLAQFGTIRQQIYTVDILARTLNPKAKEKGQDVVTAEVRLLARVYFDTFSRKAFIESMEYR